VDPNDLNHENGKRRGDGPDELPHNAVQSSAKRSLRYHTGTIAFGALIIAIIQFIRAIVAYLEKKSKLQQSKIQKCIFCLV
jgi:choline transporter-like protein 2/4/5